MELTTHLQVLPSSRMCGDFQGIQKNIQQFECAPLMEWLEGKVNGGITGCRNISQEFESEWTEHPVQDCI